MTMARRALVFALLVFSAIGPAFAQDLIVGVASVVDGDTIEIHGQRIRLFGIDAPESSQLCVRPTGDRWYCGQRASFALADRIGRATVSCQPRDFDRYGRVVAVCFKAHSRRQGSAVVALRAHRAGRQADERSDRPGGLYDPPPARS